MFDTQTDINTDPFTEKELEHTLKLLKNNKAPGTDGIPLEFYKWTNTESALEWILLILNKMWELEEIPTESEIARIVSIYKKGDTEKPENYRPIALLQSLYKIYASLL